MADYVQVSGGPITEVREWCRKHKEAIAVIELTRKDFDPATGNLTQVKERLEMPERFWRCSRWNLTKDGIPRLIRTFTP